MGGGRFRSVFCPRERRQARRLDQGAIEVVGQVRAALDNSGQGVDDAGQRLSRRPPHAPLSGSRLARSNLYFVPDDPAKTFDSLATRQACARFVLAD